MAEENVYGYKPTAGIDGDSVRKFFDSLTSTGWISIDKATVKPLMSRYFII